MKKEEESGFSNHSVCIKYKNSLPFTYNHGIIAHVILEQILIYWIWESQTQKQKNRLFYSKVILSLILYLKYNYKCAGS